MRVQLLYFQGHVQSSSSIATLSRRKACEQSQVSTGPAQLFQEEYGNMNACSLMCFLPFLLPCLSFRLPQGSYAISCEYYYLRKMKDLTVCKFRIQFKAKLMMMTVFAGNKNIYKKIKYTNMHLKLGVTLVH